VRDTVKVSGDLDVVINADATHAPFGKAIGLGRQWIEVGPVEVFQQRAAGDAEPPQRALVVELVQQPGDRRIELAQAIKTAMAQPAHQPALDDQYRGFDFCLVTHYRLLIGRVGPTTESASPIPFIRSRDGSSTLSVGGVIGARIGSPTLTTRGGCARFRPI
jgi:hypothetical protein